MIDITLPLPPSMNRIWRASLKTNKVTKAVGATVLKSEEYREWIDLAGRELLANHQARVSGWYVLELQLPAKMTGDTGNREKALSDLFVAHGLVDDDAKAWRIVIERSPHVAPKRCRVKIYSNNVTRVSGDDVARKPRVIEPVSRAGLEAR